MVKIPKIKIDQDAEADITPTPEVETPVEEKKESWPECKEIGRFVAVKWNDGYVVFNPNAQRVTGVISLIEESDMVRRQNQAAGIKG